MTCRFLLWLCLLMAAPAWAINLHLPHHRVKAIPRPAVVNPYASKTFRADNFDTISVTGPINVEIVHNSNIPSLTLTGDSYSIACAYAAVINGTLYLSMPQGYMPDSNSRINAIVNNPNVTRILYAGTGQVTSTNIQGPLSITANGTGTLVLVGKDLDLRYLQVGGSNNVHILGINSGLLTVDDSSTGKVNLGGTMVLQSVNYNGSGPLSIYWITSSDVTVRGHGSGRVFLAGVAGLLDVSIYDHMHLDARYLRVKRAFVNTNDYAQADIWTSCSESSLALDSSNIYYFNNKGFRGDYMDPPAAVLNMADIDPENLPMPKPPCCIPVQPCS